MILSAADISGQVLRIRKTLIEQKKIIVFD